MLVAFQVFVLQVVDDFLVANFPSLSRVGQKISVACRTELNVTGKAAFFNLLKENRILSFLTEHQQNTISGALVFVLLGGSANAAVARRSPTRASSGNGRKVGGLGVSIICDSGCAAAPFLDMEAWSLTCDFFGDNNKHPYRQPADGPSPKAEQATTYVMCSHLQRIQGCSSEI